MPSNDTPSATAEGRNNCTQLIFDWGTIEARIHKPVISLLVKYNDVKGKLKLSEKLLVRIDGQLIDCEVLDYVIKENTANTDNPWVELGLGLLLTSNAVEGKS